MQSGEQIGDYTIVSRIGEGGMSVVYLAKHTADQTLVVVKQLKDQYRFDPQLVDRFLRGAEILRELRHPHLARVFACLEHDGKYFMVEEYLPGGSLADLLRDRHLPYSEKEALSWCRDALRAMNYAHEHGVVHRDLKPSNLMLDAQRQVKVIDFGIARVFGEARLTRTSDGAMGTVEYMSPEQILTPGQVDHLSDVYSMGVVLYELLTGNVPFDGDTPFAVQEKVTRQPPPPIRRLKEGVTSIKPLASGIDPKLVKIVFRAIEKHAERRFGGCAEFALQLERHLSGKSRPPWIERFRDAVGQGAPALRMLSDWRALGAAAVLGLLVVVWRVNGVSEAPGITVVTGAEPGLVRDAGTVVTYTYRVTNTGNVALRNVNVTDEGATPTFAGGDADGDAALDVDETWTYEAAVPVAQARLDAGNALVSQAVARSDRVTSAPHRITVNVDRRPAIAISALVNGAKSLSVSAPRPITYTYEVRNVGNVSLTEVRVTDDGDITPVFRGGDTNRNTVLDTDETWTYQATVTMTDRWLDAGTTVVSRAAAVSRQAKSEADTTTVTFSLPPPAPLRIGGDILAPRKTAQVEPLYPADLQAAGVQGNVLIDLTIGASGRVENARVLNSTHPGLQQAALDAVKQWEYSPTLRSGVGVPVIMTVAVDFTLKPRTPNPGAGPALSPSATPVLVGGSISTPQKTKDVRPVYPALAQAARVQGVVTIEATIGTNGRVQDARVLRSIPLLDEAAIAAVKQWEFTPTVTNGVPVPVIMTVTVQFTLTERD